MQPPRDRSITAGSLRVTPLPPAVAIVQVDEFYDPVLQHYFITADEAEKQALDNGPHPGWERTGESFKAYSRGSPSGSIDPVCRFYSPARIEGDLGFVVVGADSHFFSADAGECLAVFRKWEVQWLLEVTTCSRSTCPTKGPAPAPLERFRCTACGTSGPIPITAS